MSTVGANIDAVERIAAEKAGVKYAVGLSSCTAALHLCVKLAGKGSTAGLPSATAHWRGSVYSART